MEYQFNHIGLPVDDLDESIDWYSKHFGFRKVGGTIEKEFLNITTTKIQLGNLILELIKPNISHIRPSLQRRTSLEKELSEIGISHFALGVKDTNEAYSKLKNSGVEISEFLDSDRFFCYDPNGYRIEVKKS